ncbi:MAG: hypothetical protein H7336_15155 [Bacteriovorax sp.]|nr:hypothetical protein [Bacteriovorax sp.]
MNFFKSILSVTLIILLVASCSKKEGTTVSKIKIFGSAFSTGMIATRANNGLMLYGQSSDGKMFAKKINDDSVELVFPNGVWNFYAVAWEYSGGAAADTGLLGRVSCAKSMGVSLVGADAAINLSLSNTNCDSSFHPNSELVSGERKLAKISINSCKNISGITSFVDTTLCDYNGGVIDNKGYATYVRLVVPEYSTFGNGNTPAIVSRCFAIESSSPSGVATSESSFINSINIPKSGVNGFNAYFQIF